MKTKWLKSTGSQQKICARIRQTGRIGWRKDGAHIKEKSMEHMANLSEINILDCGSGPKRVRQ